ncbi:MAG: hypothetical protein EPO35_04635 [Acidobacteria bacterium]|nr:MAG: hypothetical protein EPO35_04635 [Acidobacteriota bacterium]
MKTLAAFAIVVALAAPLSGAATPRTQTGACRVPCMHDWRREMARLGEPWLDRVGSHIAQQCADSSRVDFSGVTSNPRAGWDGLIADAQQQLQNNATIPKAVAWWRTIIRLAQDEKAHLARGLADCARRNVAKPKADPDRADSAGSASLDSLLSSRGTRGVDYDLDPIYRSWVPAYLKRMVDYHYASHEMHLDASGPVWIQRGGRRIAVGGSDARLQLRPGDIISTGGGGSVRISSPGQSPDTKLGENSAVSLGQDVACLSFTKYPNQQFGLHLIAGTLYWLTTGARLQANCAVLTTKDFSVSVRGTKFTITSKPGAATNEISVDVTEGEVEIEDRDGRMATVSEGESERLTYGLGKMLWMVDNQCRRSVDFRLFDRTNNLQWPADPSKVWFIDSGGLLAQLVSCIPGAKICYGAAAPGQEGEWGIGINGNARCPDCCQTCPAANQRVDTSRVLTCQIPGAVK